MNPELHARATELFLEICDLPPEERERILAAARERDPELCEEVVSLLRHDGQSRADEVESVAGRPAGPLPERVGPYPVLEFLGAGGMAEVFLAEREGEKVAIKILLPGRSSAEVLARFEAERRVLSRLDHPRVARIHETGEAQDGRPYFVMEYVPGIAITEYCRRHRLPLAERLELFAQACDAVHHAHERGVIHRDLKPSNVLVFLEGDRPTVKIIDFGVARALEPIRITDLRRTHRGTLLGTPAYMSPEQAEMSALDIDPRTDIYSLGVLLNELLTGRLPLEWDDLRNASLDEIRRAIRDSDPSPPSTQLEAGGSQGRRHARSCRTDLPSLAARLRGALDEIVLRALDGDRTRRHASAHELGAEVLLALEGRLPVGRAGARRRPGAGGDLGRPRRSPLLLTLCAVFLAGASGWMAYRPQKARVSTVEQAALQGRVSAARLQFELERRVPEVRLARSADLTLRTPPPPEAPLVRAQALIRTGRRVGSHDLERSAIGELLQYEREKRYEPWPARAAVRALLAEVSSRVPTAAGTDAGRVPQPPSSAEDWYLLSFATLDLKKALERARRAVALDPDSPLRLRRLAYLFEVTGRYDAALATADRLLALGEPEREWVIFRLAVMLERGEARRVLDALDARPDSWPENDTVMLALRAAAHLHLEDPAGAEAAYSAMIAFAPDIQSGYVFYRRATALWMLGDLEAAVDDYETFRRIDGRVTFADARLHFLLHDAARRARRRGEPEIAGALRDRAAAGLRAARAAVSRGTWLEKILDGIAGDLGPAELVALADAADPGQVCESYYYAGEICLLRSRRGEAVEWFRRCVETGVAFDPPSFPPIPMNEYHLARFRLAGLAF